jgi:hypothetical protein
MLLLLAAFGAAVVRKRERGEDNERVAYGVEGVEYCMPRRGIRVRRKGTERKATQVMAWRLSDDEDWTHQSRQTLLWS